MATEDGTILVTGASGFIATHIVQQLQKAGYRVRGTVRSTKNEDKIRPLKELCEDAKYPLELVEADLTKPDGWADAVKGCVYVLHTASPFPNDNPSDEMEIITPAVEGTLAVLRACQEFGGVKRVVLTSSVAAISNGFDTGGLFSEENWTDVEKSGMAYIKSKTLAEKATWDFVKELKDDEKFELAVVNPSYVIGPVLCGGWATSMELPKRLLERDMPALPHINFPTIDVRDLAAAHLKAMTVPESAGKRHIVSSHNAWAKDIAVILNEEFRPLGYKVPTSEAPYCLVKILSLFDKTVKLILPSWGKVTEFDTTRMNTTLGIQPRPLKESLNDMAYSMIEKGFVKKTQKYVQVKGNP